jgi:hypothetical protein
MSIFSILKPMYSAFDRVIYRKTQDPDNHSLNDWNDGIHAGGRLGRKKAEALRIAGAAMAGGIQRWPDVTCGQAFNSRMGKIEKMFSIFQIKSAKSEDLFSIILPTHIILDIKGKTKETIISELFDILAAQEKLLDRDIALKDILSREQSMSIGIPNDIALPHAKTTAVQELTVAIGIKRSGVDFVYPLMTKPV